MSFKIDWFYLALGMSIGMFIIYLTNPKPKVIIKHPTLENAGKISYMDDDGVCYKYKAVEIKDS